MQSYNHLTIEQRYQIAAYKEVKCNISCIATKLGVHKSTVSREIRRNKTHGSYNPKIAQEKTYLRKKYSAKHSRLTKAMKTFIRTKIKERWSPEEIVGYCRRHDICMVSHETIYRYIANNKNRGRCLYRYLRHSNKKWRKKYGSKDLRGQIQNRTSIENRPEIVDQKIRIGDWEADTVIGKNHKCALVTLVDRVTKFTMIKKVERKTAREVTNALVSMLSPIYKLAHTITVDNGKEFSFHEEIARKLATDVYFAHPYSSWERGLNENTNGLIRQYFPKKTDFTKITEKEIGFVCRELNSRPRKALEFDVPKNRFAKACLEGYY